MQQLPPMHALSLALFLLLSSSFVALPPVVDDACVLERDKVEMSPLVFWGGCAGMQNTRSAILRHRQDL